MAPPPIIEDPSHNSRRAKVRIGVAAALLITAIGILTALNQRRTEAPAEPEAAAPAQTSMSSTDNEIPPAAPPAIESQVAVAPLAAEPAAVSPPPPPVPGKLPETTATASTPSTSGTKEETEGVYQQKAAAAAQPKQDGVPATPSSQLQAQPAGAAAPKAYAVQLGVFSDPENARQLQSKLAQRGIPSRTETRVQIGPFKTRTEADRAKEKLKALGIAAVVLDK